MRFAIKLVRSGRLVRRSDGRIYTFETPQQAEEIAKICYSSRMYEIVKVEAKGSKWQERDLSQVT